MLGLIELEFTAPTVNSHVFMSRVDKCQPPCRDLKDSQPDRDKHVLPVVLADIVVHKRHDLRRCPAHAGADIDHDIDRHHKQRGRHALVRDVADPHGEMVVIDQYEVIEVAAHLFGRFHIGINIEFFSVRKRREFGRQGAVLDLFGKIQLCPDSLPLRCDRGQIVDIVDHIRLHLIDGAREIIDLLEFADVSEFLALRVLLREACRFD